MQSENEKTSKRLSVVAIVVIVVSALEEKSEPIREVVPVAQPESCTHQTFDETWRDGPDGIYA